MLALGAFQEGLEVAEGDAGAAEQAVRLIALEARAVSLLDGRRAFAVGDDEAQGVEPFDNGEKLVTAKDEPIGIPRDEGAATGSVSQRVEGLLDSVFRGFVRRAVRDDDGKAAAVSSGRSDEGRENLEDTLGGRLVNVTSSGNFHTSSPYFPSLCR